MKSLKLLLGGVAASLVLLSTLASAGAVPGKAAPDFSVKDAAGNTHTLADYKGEWLVLEWFNKDCPYVKKHYGTNNMQGLQKKYGEKDIKWLTIISSAKGKQGYHEPEEALKVAAAHNLAASAP